MTNMQIARYTDAFVSIVILTCIVICLVCTDLPIDGYARILLFFSIVQLMRIARALEK